MLLCIGGLPGAGKTTVGTSLAKRLAWALADLDSVTTPLMSAVAAEQNIDLDLQLPALAAFRGARYACLAAVCRDNLRIGRDVIAVAPFTAESTSTDRMAAWRAAVGGDAQARVVLAWLDVDAGTAARRRHRRGAPRDAAGADPAPVDPSGADIVIDARPRVDRIVDCLAQHVRRQSSSVN